MNKAISFLILCLSLVAWPLAAVEMSFNTYLKSYLQATTEISDAKKAYDEAVIAYNGAVARKASALELENLLAVRDRKAFDLRDKQNQLVIDALSLYVQYQTAVQALRIADGRLQLAEELAKSDNSQFELGLISETQFLQKALSLQNNRASQETAWRTLDDLKRKLKRVLGLDNPPVLAAAADLDAKAILTGLKAVSLEAAMAASAEILTTKADLSIKEKTYLVVSASNFAKDSEKDSAKSEYRTAKINYQKAFETLEDSVINLERSIADLAAEYSNLSLNNRIADISLETAALKQSYGDSTDSDYDSARFDHEAQINSLVQFTYKLVQKQLEILKLAGGDTEYYLKTIFVDD